RHRGLGRKCSGLWICLLLRSCQTVALCFCDCPLLAPFPLVPGKGFLPCSPVRFEPFAELLPPLCSPAAGGMLAPGEDRTICELDRKCTVFVGRRERALLQHEERTAAIRFFGPDPESMVRKPALEVEPCPLRHCILWLGVLLIRQPCHKIPEQFRAHDFRVTRGRKDPAPPVRTVRGIVAFA